MDGLCPPGREDMPREGLVARAHREGEGALPKEGVLVTTTEGKLYWGRYCLVTFSNAVILSKQVSFVPELPDWKKTALEHCPIGYFTKIFLKFPDNCPIFWDNHEWLLYVDSIPIPSIRDALEGCNRANIQEDASKGKSKEKLPSNNPEVAPHSPAFLDARKSSVLYKQAHAKGNSYMQGYYTTWLNFSKPGMHAQCSAQQGGDVDACKVLLLILSCDLARSIEAQTDEQIIEQVP